MKIYKWLALQAVEGLLACLVLAPLAEHFAQKWFPSFQEAGISAFYGVVGAWLASMFVSWSRLRRLAPVRTLDAAGALSSWSMDVGAFKLSIDIKEGASKLSTTTGFLQDFRQPIGGSTSTRPGFEVEAPASGLTFSWVDRFSSIGAALRPYEQRSVDAQGWRAQSPPGVVTTIRVPEVRDGTVEAFFAWEPKMADGRHSQMMRAWIPKVPATRASAFAQAWAEVDRELRARGSKLHASNNDDAAWDALLSDPAHAATMQKLRAELGEMASKGELGEPEIYRGGGTSPANNA